MDVCVRPHPLFPVVVCSCIRDMTSLSVNHPNVHAEFRVGKFVVRKTRNKFSAMAIDQCHEQNNGAVKGSRGAVGLTANPAALRR